MHAPHIGAHGPNGLKGPYGAYGHIYTYTYMHHIDGVCTPHAFYRGLVTSWTLNGSSGQIAPKSYDGL